MDEVLDYLEQVQSLVGSNIVLIGKTGNFLNLRFNQKIEAKTLPEWLKDGRFDMHEGIIASYWDQGDQVGINLTELRKVTSDSPSRFGISPLFAKCCEVVVHEAIVHSSTISKKLDPKEEEIMVGIAKIISEVANRKDWLEMFENPNLKVEVKGATFIYSAPDRNGRMLYFKFPNKIDEAMTFVITGEIVTALLIARFKISREKAMEVFWVGNSNANMVPKDFIAASRFYHSVKSRMANSYFSGTFFREFLFGLPDKSMVKVLGYVVKDEVQQFYNHLPQGRRKK